MTMKKALPILSRNVYLEEEEAGPGTVFVDFSFVNSARSWSHLAGGKTEAMVLQSILAHAAISFRLQLPPPSSHLGVLSLRSHPAKCNT
jgi:hypothetical protein